MYSERHHVPAPDQENRLEKEQLAQDYKEQALDLQRRIAAMETPLGHGTTSEYLASILEKELGGIQPEKAFAGTKSATDLRVPDGLLGAYLFSRFTTESLEVTSEQLSGEDAIARYARLNPDITEERLREAFAAYVEKRKPEGFPVLFVYDGGKDAMIRNVNPRVPSEVEFEGSLTTDKLRILLVPKAKMAETAARLKELGISAEVRPIETMEVS